MAQKTYVKYDRLPLSDEVNSWDSDMGLPHCGGPLATSLPSIFWSFLSRLAGDFFSVQVFGRPFGHFCLPFVLSPEVDR